MRDKNGDGLGRRGGGLPLPTRRRTRTVSRPPFFIARLIVAVKEGEKKSVVCDPPYTPRRQDEHLYVLSGTHISMCVPELTSVCGPDLDVRAGTQIRMCVPLSTYKCSLCIRDVVGQCVSHPTYSPGMSSTLPPNNKKRARKVDDMRRQGEHGHEVQATAIGVREEEGDADTRRVENTDPLFFEC